ncbi:MAG: alpha/beta hydrolase [Lachnospiraceae bacterium]
MNKKLTAVLSFFGLGITSVASLSAVNKAISQLAVSKELLNPKNKGTYHWRFGDISYIAAGEGKPVLLIHNLKEDSSSAEWSEIFHKLSAVNTVYCIDLLGCGLSERPDITYTSYMYTQLVNDFIRNIIKKKTNIIATGRSASFVLDACNIDEEIYEELILINPENIKVLHKMPSKRTRTAAFLLKLPTIGTFIYHILTAKKRIVENFKNNYFYDAEKIPDALYDYYYESSHLKGKDAKNLFVSLTGRYTNANIIQTLKNINKNIHILAGNEISGIEETVKEYQYYNPAIEAEYISYTKELPQLEAPNKILRYIRLYLDND